MQLTLYVPGPGCGVWGLSLNPSKCKALSLSLRRTPVQNTYIYMLSGEILERVSEMRDLGVILDEKLTFSCQIDQVVSKANRALGLMIKSFQANEAYHFITATEKASSMLMCKCTIDSRIWQRDMGWCGWHASQTSRMCTVQVLGWLCARCHINDVPLRYDELVRYFDLKALSECRQWPYVLGQCSPSVVFFIKLFTSSL